MQNVNVIRTFLWDKGNSNKNLKKHNVSDLECEEVFFDQNKIAFKDKLHSGKEERFILLGKTKRDRLLFLVFTLRGNQVRVISSRDINKKEKYLYEKTN
ncbi:MAG: BrnT family toxin [bacterium]|nr:BrnT family toxin [bacterium]